VPITNARYALNAANARWGSLYDALYGTDALGDRAAPGPYDPARGARVVEWAKAFLDESAPLAEGSHADVSAYAVGDGGLTAVLVTGGTTGLADPAAFAGWRGEPGAPDAILLKRNGLHAEIRIDRGHPIGRNDAAGVADVILESAVTAIMDCEDSVACVDAEDKVHAWRNWLGLVRGDLTESVSKGGETFTRRMNPDRAYTAAGGGTLTLPGRALMLVRNVAT
jgi:Malate synthase